MGFITGMAAIQARIEAEEAKFNNTDYVKAEWFRLKDKQSANVQFLQDLDKGNKGYSEKNGLAVMAVEHSHPKLYRNKALCTIDDEGRCYGCEMNTAHPKTGWKQKSRLYVNVAVDYGDGDTKVVILSSGFGKGQVAPVLMELLKPDPDDEPFDLTHTKFRITRNGGEVSNTAYLLTPKGATKTDPESYELFDLEKVLRHVPYGEQAEFYNRGAVSDESDAQDGEQTVSASSSDAADEW